MSASKWKPYPEYFDTNIKSMPCCPSNWEIKKLKHVSEIITGNTPSMKDSSNYAGGTHLWVKPNEIKGFEPTNDTGEKLTDAGRELSRVLPPFSIFVNGIGNIGEFGFSKKSVSTNQQLNSIIFNEQVNNRYGIFLVSALKEEFILNSEKVVVAILNKSKQENIRFALPSIKEQKLISSFLDFRISKIDSIIGKLEIEMHGIEENRFSLITQAVTKGLNPDVLFKDSGVEWIGPTPAHWELKRTDWFLRVNKNQVLANDLGEEVFHYSIPSIRDKGDGEIESSRNVESSKFQINQPTLLVSKLNPRKGMVLIGEEREMPTICSSEFVPLLPEDCSLDWAYYLFLSDSTRQRLASVVQSATRSHQRARPDHVTSMWHEVPSTDEQLEIAAYINRNLLIMRAIENKIETKIGKLKEYRTALISAAVTGKIDVRGLA